MNEATICLRKVGLWASEEAVDGLLKHAQTAKLSPLVLLEKLVEIEIRERDARNLERRSRAATLGKLTSMDKFDWAFPRSVDRSLIEHLLTVDFVSATPPANVLLRGAAGVGKTTIAKNLGLAALQAGHTVRFSTLPNALADLLRQESLPAVERRIKRYTTPDLLILDELGYVPADHRAADLLFNIVSRRHEEKSTVITTNLPYKQWGTIFPGATCLSPLIDRFAEHCHVVDNDADSYRL
ncbi:MAG: ATP-binding protein, partial [Myxococcota bacterium]